MRDKYGMTQVINQVVMNNYCEFIIEKMENQKI